MGRTDRIPELVDKVEFLNSPRSYPHRPDQVQAIETHMAWVFLAGNLVFKMKKPVSYAFLDFRSLEAREFTCREEVRLNERLAPGIYLGVVPLRQEMDGQLTFGGYGRVVEWLVEMKRLPSERMLDAAIEGGLVTADAIDAASRHLVAFYQRALPVSRSLDEVFTLIEAEHQRNCLMLSDDRFTLDRNRVVTVLRRMSSAISEVKPWIDERLAAGAIVEGHGDLRPEHFCLTDPPVVIDCIEFNRELRLVDPYDEIAFFALECERLNASWIGERVLEFFRSELQPAASPALTAFYKANRALLRARLALAHLTEQSPRTPEKWEPRAGAYVALADAALEQFKLAIGRKGKLSCLS